MPDRDVKTSRFYYQYGKIIGPLDLLGKIIIARSFIVLEREIPGLDTMMDGKSLSLASNKLKRLAKKLGVTPLSEFLSIDPVKFSDFLKKEGIRDSVVPIPPLQHFSGEQGLVTIRALLDYIKSHRISVPNSSGVLKDLQDCERILLLAANHRVRWRMDVEL